MPETPKFIFLFSGKRKSGKDYITDLLQARLGFENCKIIRLSGPIKHQFALDNGLDYKKLLSASEYKEKYRLEMIAWSEAKRATDHGFFIKAAIDMYEGNKFPVWIVSDMRRRSDLQWFKENYSDVIYTIRIRATKEVRMQRGWIFTPGVDDAESECDLDGIRDWNKEFDNSNGSETVEELLNQLKEHCTPELQEF